MKQKTTLFAGALVLMLSAGTAQAHGSLLGIFFKHHAHDACGNHYQDYHADARRACHKKHYAQHNAHHYSPKKHYKKKTIHYAHKPKHHYGHGHGSHYEPKSFIW